MIRLSEQDSLEGYTANRGNVCTLLSAIGNNHTQMMMFNLRHGILGQFSIFFSSFHTTIQPDNQFVPHHD